MGLAHTVCALQDAQYGVFAPLKMNHFTYCVTTEQLYLSIQIML